MSASTLMLLLGSSYQWLVKAGYVISRSLLSARQVDSLPLSEDYRCRSKSASGSIRIAYLLLVSVSGFSLLFPAISTSEIVSHAPNGLKPHLARDLVIRIPEMFNRFSYSSHVSFKDIFSTNRYISTTTRELLPGSDYHVTLGGFSPDSTYNIQIIVNDSGTHLSNEIITFTTAESPPDEISTLLMVIDEDLGDADLERQYENYITGLMRQEKSLKVQKYYLADTEQARRDLNDYIRSGYFTDNIYSLFFIGKNGSFPVEIYLLDEQGAEANSYFYQGFSFYTHIWNNPFRFSSEKDAYVLVSGLNNSTMPDRYTPLRNNSGMAEISYGAFVPDSPYFHERQAQTIEYLRKVSNYRAGVIGYDRRVLYSDTMYGNEYLVNDLANIKRWSNPVSIDTTHIPDPSYHGSDVQWKAAYLENIENQSFEVGWINVHGAPTYHYFGISSTDIDMLRQLHTAYVSLQSCNTGNYKMNNYLAGCYLNQSGVLAVEANIYPTFYVKSSVTEFSPFHTLYEVAAGKRIGDAVRQHGSVHIGHMLYGDPMLIIDQEHYLTLHDVVALLQVMAGNEQQGASLLHFDADGDTRLGIPEVLHILREIGNI